MPILLDTRTLLFASALISGSMVPLMYASRRARVAIPGWGLWMISGIAFSAALSIEALTGLIPSFFPNVLSPFLVILAVLLASAGVRLCRGKSWRAPVLEIISPLLFGTQLFFVLVRNSPYIGVLLNSVLLAIIGGYTAIPLVRESPAGRQFGYRFAAIVFLCGIPEVVFWVWMLVHPGMRTENSLANTMFSIGVLLFLVLLAFSYFLLTNERLMAELRIANRAVLEASEERIRIQARLAGAERMEAIGRLAGGISHVFNNQMCIVQLNCEHLLDSPELPESHRGPLKRIEAAADRATEITSRLQQFARSVPLEFSTFDIGKWLESVSADLRRRLGETIELRIECPEQPLVVQGDANQLAAILGNLASNAQHAMPEGGSLTLGCEAVELTAGMQHGMGALQGKFVRLTATDTGCGMDESAVKRIFEPFYSTRSLPNADGLGLSSAYGLMQKMGGTMTAESALGQGSTFYLYLQAAETGSSATGGEGSNQAAVGIY